MTDYKKLCLERGRLIQKQQEANDILFAENEQLKKQLEAAKAQIHRCCGNCAHYHKDQFGDWDCDSEYEPSACMECANWQWRGKEEKA